VLENANISNIGLKGLNTDLTAWDLPAEFITDGSNFRVQSNNIISTGSYTAWSIPPINLLPGLVARVGTIGGDFWLVVGRNGVYVWSEPTWTNIDSIAGYTLAIDGELDWTVAMLGRIPIINNPAHVPEYWSPQSAGQIMQPLEFSPGVDWVTAGKSFRVIRSHKNFLFALNLVEGGVTLENSYRWSHPAENNGLPFTWDETDVSSLASIEQLGAEGGVIIDGLSLRDSFCIYSERSINLLDLSNDEFVFNRRELSSTVGIVNKNSIVEINGSHLFLSDGDIFKNDGNKIQSIIHNRLRRRFNSRLNASAFNRSFVIRNTVMKEVWFCVPENKSKYPNIAYVYNWADDSWALKDLPPSLTHASYGSQSDTILTYDTVTSTYDSIGSTYDAGNRTPLDETVIGCRSNDGALIFMDPVDEFDVNIDSKIERTGFALNGVVANFTVSRIYPYMAGKVPVNIQIGAQARIGGPVTWSALTLFDPSVDRKLDIRISGALFCWRVSSIGIGKWSMSGMSVEYALTGSR